MNAKYYIGIMSGTSLDGVDIALVDFSLSKPKLVASDFTPMPNDLREKITTLVQSGETTLKQLGMLDHQLGLLYVDCVNHFLQSRKLLAEQIQAIGCHGQTIWHSPLGRFPFTMQIGDMNLLAARTGITTVGDFRRKDMAFGGQGAPLVPAFHQAIFFDPNYATVVLNIGGISNVSLLIPNQPVMGFDTGTGNTLLDQWIEKHLGIPYDKNGEWAATGQINEVLLDNLLEESFFRQPPPKSTGRELFNLSWLEQKIQNITTNSTALLPQDIQATLVEFTVSSIAASLNSIDTTLPKRLLVCGGGAKNKFIMQRLANSLPNWEIYTTNEFGMDADYVEAAAFAWLAYRRMNHQTGNLPDVTGAQRAVGLGAIFPMS
ncbi:anhydro-N-acetylmuramic acid kinase [Rodentibacter pneumotropicus]|uniref:anhydro-N-acetylmuramic acid kinase n=1 Tax=Rodentibacter pneumotropicus TaxID=758 RepID=UPI0004771678|nr:anhydro-N-acetylmuramic acid kinase [Rodentibacter pneumotropicus]NBH76326.1 anhydro-N-acetylmuramic acid kinase [Rodentibacter pneumotropicus]OOF64852.1 anhydro-N-acetylmuramic acid kinase [Rodentibacter pneumotropicus]THA03631.1 anhydro-N-acetylmuramic acid kinase [Rodentibacter pneumotropicus]THA07627.1 anhydro-N-acetylmuramic acid kinase [Rodentibacter pneumotropicus]THA10853.1 anhydro-N-acetylmuramic acid kinase [Rodentibacter pneumotropicus]